MWPRNKRYITATICLPLLMAAGRLYAAATATDAQWRQLTSDKALNYAKDVEAIAPRKPADASLVERLLAALFYIFGNGAGRVLLWIIVLAVVVYVLYKLLFSGDSILFGKGSKKMEQQGPAATAGDDIATTNWEDLLHKAMAANDSRLAIRYSYMRLLQLLQQRGKIAFSADKTNLDYYTELGETVYRQQFRQLSRQYEYAWYGQYQLSETDYHGYMASFAHLKKQLGE